jgi:hypothetical protein
MPASRSPPSSADVASAAGGSARTTSMAPAGSSPSLGARRCRSRRLTRWRTTEPPTALLTTSPARGAPVAGRQCMWTTSLLRPLRHPRLRTTTNSSRRVSRDPAGSTGPAGSGGEPLAALATAGRDDGAPRAGAHAQPEAMRTGPAAVVGLEGALALAHGRLSWSTAMLGRPSLIIIRVFRTVVLRHPHESSATPGARQGAPRAAHDPHARARLHPGYAACGEGVKPGHVRCPRSSCCPIA